MTRSRKQSVIREAKARDGSCQRCNSTDDLVGHHVVPLADGGADHVDNVIILCGTCHHGWHHRCEGWVVFEHFLQYSHRPETRSHSHRVREGMEAARAQGQRLGRPPISPEIKREIVRLRSLGMPKNAIGRALGVSYQSVIRILASRSAKVRAGIMAARRRQGLADGHTASQSVIPSLDGQRPS